MDGTTLNSTPATTNKRKRIRPEYVIVGAFLALAIGIATLLFMPRYYTFSAMGKLVPVRDLGIEGSVRFVYVNEGVARNWIERWNAKQAYPDAEFERTDASAFEEMEEMLDYGEEARDDTILNALTSAEDETEGYAEEDAFQSRLDELVEQASGYYGDSLGLMVSLGLVEETRGEDFSQGGRYVIAGTGTIEYDHTVGSVGGIRDKLRTAEKFGADYFFVPKDKEDWEYVGLSNEEEAEEVARELQLTLRVVPVDTMEDALDFLDTL
ncbi:hypothetical protein ACFPPD_01780 [Cohnella suwonensis]|uniref:Lon proteolytic domain-containing protein n=1 Tax=Cohnella suwonensis TaxID=696072 RepID=A0ABW0LNF4_9BACL